MTLSVFTAHVAYPGPSRLDVSRKSGDAVFAPSWELLRAAHPKFGGTLSWPDYVDAYTEEMRQSYRANRPVWDALLGGNRVVLCCYCRNEAQCHRTVLAKILTKLGAKFYGEITEWDSTVEQPLFAGRAS